MLDMLHDGGAEHSAMSTKVTNLNLADIVRFLDSHEQPFESCAIQKPSRQPHAA